MVKGDRQFVIIEN